MDCGQDPGPAAGRPCREGRSRSRTPSSSAEEQVAMETEAVFHSYVFHRYQQEQESSGGQSPRDPEMAAISHNPGSVMEQVGRQLAIIGDDINRRYEPEFQGMLLILRPTEENAFTYFTKIACRRPSADSSRPWDPGVPRSAAPSPGAGLTGLVPVGSPETSGLGIPPGSSRSPGSVLANLERAWSGSWDFGAEAEIVVMPSLQTAAYVGAGGLWTVARGGPRAQTVEEGQR
ncbi:bcl-2 homologous antagonist/killer isoform X2 [Ornithorhynchus anatinus]|uniref:bcl-2 homologous antagonist/killer isoform X2 n=1 Tax=Ornithorhynchus anatinus TaxID=9258 RepID=UPI0010A93BA1|nr:bcl-2 homologous antagonist/killer isoform X2 [Ornithorhynchus anatinus]